MRFTILTLLLGIMLIGMICGVSAETETYGLNELIQLPLKCTIDDALPSESATMNVTISDTNGNVVVDNQEATRKSAAGSFYYNYTFTQLGVYTIDVDCVDGELSDSEQGYYNITPNGFANTFAFYLMICLIIVGLITLGYKTEEEWFIIIGGMLLMMFGLYTINQGLAGFKDMFMTWGVGIIEMGVGFILTIIAGSSKMQS